MSMILQGGTKGGIGFMVGYIVFLVAIVYFLFIRPSKKQQAQQKDLMDSLKPGDTVMTTSGFYGTIIGMDDDTVIVEFGNNKNCRIPMHKKAIAEVEKPEEAVKEDAEEEKSSKKIGKKKEN